MHTCDTGNAMRGVELDTLTPEINLPWLQAGEVL